MAPGGTSATVSISFENGSRTTVNPMALTL
jgi:hypothetical protein